MTVEEAVELLKALPCNALEESDIDLEALEESLENSENTTPLMEGDGGTVDEFLDEWNNQKKEA